MNQTSEKTGRSELDDAQQMQRWIRQYAQNRSLPVALNMLVPMAGYGLLVSLIGHLYSRWALHRVRWLAAQQLAGAKLPLEDDRT